MIRALPRPLGMLAAMAMLGGCTEQSPVLEPIVEVPAPASAAYPYEGIEELELSIARAGTDEPLALASAAAGEPLVLANIPFGNDLVVHLSGMTAGVEISYGRTCPIDVAPDAPLLQPRLYFARIVRWGVLPDAMPRAPTRTGGHGYATAAGDAVFLGGDSDQVEMFDAVNGDGFAPLAPRTILRRGAVLVPLGNDTALIVGGLDQAGDAVPRVEVLDPGATTAGRQLEAFDGPALAGHAGVRLVDGTAIVAGGQEQDAPGMPFAISGSAWLFRIGAGGVLEAPERLPAAMQVPRGHHTMTRLGNELGADVLVVGGMDATDQPVAQAELYRPLRDTFEPIDGATLQSPRWDHVAVRMPGGFVLVLGGMTADPVTGVAAPAPTLELYDPVQGTFAPAGVLPDDAGLTELTVTPLPDGRVLLAGGRDAGGQPVSTVLIARLDPIDGQVDLSPSHSLQIPRAGHSAVSLCDGTILVVGGTGDAGAPAERYNPPSAGRR